MNAKEKVYTWIDENQNEVTGLLQRLIQPVSYTHLTLPTN